MDIRVRVGQRIKELRIEKGLTQEGIAFKADVDRTYMNHVENGKRNITIASLAKIIVALDSSFESFFQGFNSQMKLDGNA